MQQSLSKNTMGASYKKCVYSNGSDDDESEWENHIWDKEG